MAEFISTGIYDLQIIHLVYASILFVVCSTQVYRTWQGWLRKRIPKNCTHHQCFLKRFVHRVCLLTLIIEILRGVDLYGIQGIYPLHAYILLHVVPKFTSFWIVVEYAIATIKTKKNAILEESDELSKKTRLACWLFRIVPFGWYTTELLVHYLATTEVGNVMDIVSYVCTLVGYTILGLLIWTNFKTLESLLLLDNATTRTKPNGRKNRSKNEKVIIKLITMRWMWVGALVCGAAWTLIGCLNRIKHMDHLSFGEQDLNTVNASNLFSALNTLLFCTLFLIIAWAKPISQPERKYTNSRICKKSSDLEVVTVKQSYPDRFIIQCKRLVEIKRNSREYTSRNRSSSTSTAGSAESDTSTNRNVSTISPVSTDVQSSTTSYSADHSLDSTPKALQISTNSHETYLSHSIGSSPLTDSPLSTDSPPSTESPDSTDAPATQSV